MDRQLPSVHYRPSEVRRPSELFIEKWQGSSDTVPESQLKGRRPRADFQLATTTPCPCKQKPIKNLGENVAWAYPGTSQISGVWTDYSGS